jgi:hyperosmotically inducible protein
MRIDFKPEWAASGRPENFAFSTMNYTVFVNLAVHQIPGRKTTSVNPQWERRAGPAGLVRKMQSSRLRTCCKSGLCIFPHPDFLKPTHLEKGTIMKSAKYLLPLGFAVLLGACAPTSTSRSTGQAFDDASITARVKTEIAQKESLGQAAAINVDTYRGVVSLSGFVDNRQQANDAAQVAKQVAGVSRVVNNLEVKPQSSGR